MRELGVGKLRRVVGRYYAMDRDNRWERIEIAYARSYTAKRDKDKRSRGQHWPKSYEGGVTDEFVKPLWLLRVTEHRGVRRNDSR